MKRKIGTWLVCGALVAPLGVPAASAMAGGGGGGGSSAKCERLLKRYLTALDQGKNHRAQKFKRKLKRNDCRY